MSNSIGRSFGFFSLLKFAFPTMIMMMFMSLYTIVDGIFVSRLVGSNALSAMNIVFPILSLVIALGVMLGSGGSAIVAKKMGEGKEQEACSDFTALTVISAALGFLVMAAGILFLEPLCKVLGANEILLADCKTYLKILLYFAPMCMLQLQFQTFFVTAGRPGLGLALTVLGGIANMILDYVFMYYGQMGIAGAAVATGIGQSIPSVFGLFFFFFMKKGLRFVKPVYRMDTFWKSCSNGSSEMVSNLSNAVITYLFNIIMLKLLGEDGVAAITIVLYGQFLFNSMYLGFSMGVAPIFSFNYGMGNQKEIKKVYGICVRFIIGSSILILAAALAMTDMIVGIFTPAGTGTYVIAREGFFLFSYNYIFAGLNIFASAMFTAFSDGKVSAIISFCRTFVFIVVSILVLPLFLGTTGVWLAVPLAEFLTFFIAVWFFVRKRRDYHYA